MYYYNSFDDLFETIAATIALVPVIWALIGYVLSSLSMQTIAKRRGLSKPWLAWIPVASDWLLGSVSDQFQYLTQNKVQSRRKILMGLSVAGALSSAVALAVSVLLMMELGLAGGRMDPSMLIGMLMIWLVCMVVVIARYVFRCMSIYDLYRSCEPKNATAYLVLGILFGVTEPFFLLACRNKDLGMPPRKPENEFP